LSAKDPWFSFVAAATLALGIGFNATLFTIVNGMGDGPPVDRPERVVSLGSLNPAGRDVGLSYLDFEDWRRTAKSVDAFAAYGGGAMNLTDRGLVADRVAGAYISAGAFPLIGERPILGRDFLPADDRPGAARVVIIAASLWKSRYAGDAAIIGRSITVNGVPMTIVGVMREGFRFPLVHDIWQPLGALPGLTAQKRDVRTLRAFGRLAAGVPLEQARSELETIAAGLSQTYPATNANVRPRVKRFTGGFDLTNPWNAMLAAVSIVLLIACANVANLLLARAAHRSTEIAIRTSLGATRWRIVRQLVVESLVLAVVAGVAGVGIATLGVRLWLASMPVANWPYWYHFEINARVLAYLTEVSLVSVLLFGVGPALYISKTYPGGHRRRARAAVDRRAARCRICADALAAGRRRSPRTNAVRRLPGGRDRRHLACDAGRARSAAAEVRDARTTHRVVQPIRRARRRDASRAGRSACERSALLYRSGMVGDRPGSAACYAARGTNRILRADRFAVLRHARPSTHTRP
jgi:predicted permease